VTEFSEPAPIEAVPDAAKVRQRRGFEPGKRQYPAAAPGGGGYVQDVPEPEVDAPTTSTTAPDGGSSTTTTLDDEGGIGIN